MLVVALATTEMGGCVVVAVVVVGDAAGVAGLSFHEGKDKWFGTVSKPAILLKLYRVQASLVILLVEGSYMKQSVG